MLWTSRRYGQSYYREGRDASVSALVDFLVFEARESWKEFKLGRLVQLIM